MLLTAPTPALQPSHAALSEKWHGLIKVHTLIVLTASVACKVGRQYLALKIHLTDLTASVKATIFDHVSA